MKKFKDWLNAKSPFHLLTFLTIVALQALLILFAGSTRCVAPHLGWLKFLTDPGLWGGILGGFVTLTVLYFTVRSGQQQTYMAMHADLFTEAVRLKRTYADFMSRFRAGILVVNFGNGKNMRLELASYYQELAADNPFKGFTKSRVQGNIEDLILILEKEEKEIWREEAIKIIKESVKLIEIEEADNVKFLEGFSHFDRRNKS